MAAVIRTENLPPAGTEAGLSQAFFPRTLKDALRIRADYNVLPYAGGTDLMVKHRRPSGCIPALDRPPLFLAAVPELRRIRIGTGMEAGTGAGLFIGACVTLTELLKHPAIPELLKLAAAEMAAPGIRNIATLGGNICNASPAGDTLPPLYVLEAEVVLLSLRGRRILPIAEFILGPGKTCLAPDELLTEVLLPPLPDGARWVYRKAGTRKAQALSKVSLAALFASRAENSGRPPQITEAAGPKNAEARIALGAVAPTVFRSKELEARLAGLAPNGNLQRITEIAAAYGAAVAPIDDQRSTADYRRRTAARLVEWAAGESFIK